MYRAIPRRSELDGYRDTPFVYQCMHESREHYCDCCGECDTATQRLSPSDARLSTRCCPGAHPHTTHCPPSTVHSPPNDQDTRKHKYPCVDHHKELSWHACEPRVCTTTSSLPRANGTLYGFSSAQSRGSESSTINMCTICDRIHILGVRFTLRASSVASVRPHWRR